MNINRLLDREFAKGIAEEFGIPFDARTEKALETANHLVQIGAERDCMGNVITSERLFRDVLDNRAMETKRTEDYALLRAEERHFGGRYDSDFDV